MKAKSKMTRAKAKAAVKKARARILAKKKAPTLIELLNKHADLKMALRVTEDRYNVADNTVEDLEQELEDARLERDRAEEALSGAEDDLRDFEEKYKEQL